MIKAIIEMGDGYYLFPARECVLVPGLPNTLQFLATPSEFKSRHGLGFIHLNI